MRLSMGHPGRSPEGGCQDPDPGELLMGGFDMRDVMLVAGVICAVAGLDFAEWDFIDNMRR